MTRLFIEPEAEEELDEAAARYEDAVPGLGQQFLAEMRQRVGDVLEMPLSFPVFGDGSRPDRCDLLTRSDMGDGLRAHAPGTERLPASPRRSSRPTSRRRTAFASAEPMTSMMATAPRSSLLGMAALMGACLSVSER